jgi:phage/plasmid-associated DNA primase
MGREFRNVTDKEMKGIIMYILRNTSGLFPIYRSLDCVERIFENWVHSQLTSLFKPNYNLIGFDNGILDLRDRRFSGYFGQECVVRVNCEYDKIAKCTKWMKFLSHAFVGDESKIRVLQEYLGASMMDRSWYMCDVPMFFRGEKSNGILMAMDIVEEIGMTPVHRITVSDGNEYGISTYRDECYDGSGIVVDFPVKLLGKWDKSDFMHELPGIFNWILSGFDMIQNQSGVFSEIGSTIIEEDSFQLFLKYRGWMGDRGKSRIFRTAQEIYRQYVSWCDDYRKSKISRHNMNKCLVSKGFRIKMEDEEEGYVIYVDEEQANNKQQEDDFLDDNEDLLPF